MKAVLYQKPCKLTVEEMPDSKIEATNGALRVDGKVETEPESGRR